MPFSILFRESPKGIRKLLLFYLFTWFYKGRNVQTNVIKQYKNIKMKKKKLIFILALFAALWYSCYDDLPGSWKHKQEDTQKTGDNTMRLDAAKRYYSHISQLVATDTGQNAWTRGKWQHGCDEGQHSYTHGHVSTWAYDAKLAGCSGKQHHPPVEWV